MKIPDIPIAETELSTRAQNVLQCLNIGSLGQLSRAAQTELTHAKNSGDTTIREFIRACVTHYIVPQWLNERSIPLRGGDISDAPLPGYAQIAGPYSQDERPLLELAIAQLGAIPWLVVRENGGTMLYRSTSGLRDVEQEEEI